MSRCRMFPALACLSLIGSPACAHGRGRPAAESAAPTPEAGYGRIAGNRSASVALTYSVQNAEGQKGEAVASGVALSDHIILTASIPFPEGVELLEVEAVVLRSDASIERSPAKIIMESPTLGLAILETRDPMTAHVVIRADAVPEPGDALYAVDTQTVTNGFVVGQVHVGHLAHIDSADQPIRAMVVETAAFARSSRGGGVFNRRGELVGLTTMPLFAGDESTTTRDVAVAASEIVKFLRANGIAFDEAE